MPLKIANKILNKDFIKSVRGWRGPRFMKLFHKITLFLAMASLRYFFAKRLIANMESAFPPFSAF